jgi:hypothetical protein
VKKINYPNLPDKDRAMAMDRALYMSKLFQKQHFDKIMAVINQKAAMKLSEDAAKDLFIEVCGEADLTGDEMIWLWNYLKNFDPDLAEATRRANPGVGW